MDIVKEMYIDDTIEYLQNLKDRDKQGYYTEKDINNRIEFIINNLKKALK